MGATEPGTAVVSLGTSDTMFAAMAAPRTDPKGYGNVFGNPAGGFMALCCFSNGSLAREEVAKRFNLGWDDFARAILEQTRPGNDGNMLLPYFVPGDHPPPARPGAALVRVARLRGRQERRRRRPRRGRGAGAVDAPALGLHRPAAPARILVTGGASKNAGILRVLADVFQAEIVPLRVSNSSALGGALRAAQAVEGRPGASFTPVSRPPTWTDASRLTRDQK